MLLNHQCLGARLDRPQRCARPSASPFGGALARPQPANAPARRTACKQQLRASAVHSAAPPAALAKGPKGDRPYLLSISGPPSSLLPDTCWVLDPFSSVGELVSQAPGRPLGALVLQEQYELSPQAAAARAEARELRAMLEMRQQELEAVRAELAVERAGREDMQRQYQQVVAAKDVQLQQLFAYATESERERAALQADLAEVQNELGQLKQMLQARLTAAADEERRQQQQAAAAMDVVGELHALSRSLVEDSRRDEHESKQASTSNGSKHNNNSSSASYSSSGTDLLVSAGYGETSLKMGRLFGRNGAAVAESSGSSNGNGRH